MAFESAYTAWLQLTEHEPDLHQELLSIRGDQKAIEDRFYTDLSFGTGGMRGILGAGPNRLNLFTLRRAAAGLADHLKAEAGSQTPNVAIGYDSRRYSDRFARETALVLAARGVRAYLFDSLRPVPVLSYAVRRLKADAGVVITASHNPPAYNGFKVYGRDGAQLAPEAADIVTKNIYSLDYATCLPMAEEQALDLGLLKAIGKAEVDDAYTRMVLGLMQVPEQVKEKGGELSIVYTPLHGSGNIPVRRVLQEAGFSKVSVVKEQELPDPDFSTVKQPNPEDPRAFDLAIPLAQEVGASLIMGTDPDCDRLGLCVREGDGSYTTLSGNQIGVLLLHHILSQQQKKGSLPANGAVVMSIVSTQMAKALCEDFGVTLLEVLTGFKYVGEAIQQFEESGEFSFLFGFEESYGYLSGTSVRDKDAVNAALLAAEAAFVCAQEGHTLSQHLEGLYKRYGYYHEITHSADYPGKEGAKAMQEIMARLRENPPSSVAGHQVKAVRDYKGGSLLVDGVKQPLNSPPANVIYLELEGGRLCARPSGTEPKIKFYAGAQHKGSMEEAKQKAEALLLGILS